MVLIFTSFSLVPCARLNWQFSVSFQAHINLPSRIILYTIAQLVAIQAYLRLSISGLVKVNNNFGRI